MSKSYEKENEEIERAARGWYIEGNANSKKELMALLWNDGLKKSCYSKVLSMLNNSKKNIEASRATESKDSRQKYFKEIPDFDDIYVNALIGIIEKYSPEKSDKFMTFYYNFIARRCINAMRKKKIDNTAVRDEQYVEDDNGEEVSVFFSDCMEEEKFKHGQSIYCENEDSEDAADRFAAYTSAILFLKGKGKREQNKFDSYSLLHTESTARYVKGENELKYIKKHESTVFEAINTDFLDYFTERVCRTLSQIQQTRLTHREDIQFKRNNNGVYSENIFYFNASMYINYYKANGISKDKTAISKMKCKYDKFLKGEKDEG